MKGIGEEFQECSFGDERLKKRLRKISEGFASNSDKSIPNSFSGWAEVKGTYRFLDNPKVKREEILNSHISNTVERVKECETILAIQDTTSINFTRHKNTKGLGYLEVAKEKGIILHTMLAVTEESKPLGILSQQSWIRDVKELGKSKFKKYKPTSEKESQKWITAIEDAERLVSETTHIIMVADRESDISDVIFRKRAVNSDYVIRTYHERFISGTKLKMYEELLKKEEAARVTLHIENTSYRKGREAVLSVRYGSYEIVGTNFWKDKKVGVSAVIVNEIGNPELKEKEKPLKWLLLTSLNLENIEDVLKVVNIYRTRWIIEKYHYTLKSGCKVEELQLEEKRRLEIAITIYCVVAWFLLWLTYMGRKYTEMKCRFILKDEEWKILYKMVYKNKSLPQEAPTINEITRMLARLGGFLGRKHDGFPGVKTIWQGLVKFLIVLEFYYVFQS